MKRLLCLLLQTTFVYTIYAQTRESAIPLEESELLDFIDLQQKGVVLFTGRTAANIKKLDWKLVKLDAEMNTVYDISPEKTQINKGFTNHLVSDISGKRVYLIEPRGYNTIWGQSSIHINQIDEKGTLKSKRIEEVRKTIKYTKLITCTDNYLMYIQTQTNKVWNHKKRGDEIVTFQRFNHYNMDYSNATAQLPPPRLSKNASYWTFIGTNGKEIYFAQEELDEKKMAMVADVAVLNEDGKLLRSFTINVLLDEGHFLRPSKYERSSIDSWVSDPDFYLKSRSSTSTGYATGVKTTTTTYTPVPFVSAFTHIQYDPLSSAIYVFGLFGPHTYENMGSKYEGYYMMRYDNTGKKLWKTEEAFNETLQKDRYLKVDAAPENRVIHLRCDEKKTILFLAAKKTGIALEFNGQTGKSTLNVEEFKKPIEGGGIQIVSPSGQRAAVKYHSSLVANKKKVEPYIFFYSDKGEILVELRKKELGLLYFK